MHRRPTTARDGAAPRADAVLPDSAAADPPRAADPLLRLQRQAGNRAVTAAVRGRPSPVAVQRDGLDGGTHTDAGVPPAAGVPEPPAVDAGGPPAPPPPTTRGAEHPAVPSPAAPAPAAPAPAAPAPADSAPAPVPASTTAGVVVVEPEPVPVTPVPAAETLVAGIDPGARFGGFAEVTAFAEALAVQYAARIGVRQLTGALREEVERRTRRALAAEPADPAESARARRARIDAQARAARATVTEPARGDAAAVAAQREQYRLEMLGWLEANWLQHATARQARSMPAHTLANLWMVTRNQELLFRLSTMTRPAGSMQMWTHYRLMTPEREAATRGAVAPADVDPSTVAGGPQRHDAQLVTARAAEFLADLHRRFPHERWTTRTGHGSGGFVDRGLSVDMYLTGRAEQPRVDYGETLAVPGLPRSSTYWVRERMMELFRAVEAAAIATNMHVYALYNDFSVARAANALLTRGTVGFAGNVDGGGALNYHGGGNKLHVHIDLVPDELMELTPAGRRLQPVPANAPAPTVAPADTAAPAPP